MLNRVRRIEAISDMLRGAPVTLSTRAVIVAAVGVLVAIAAAFVGGMYVSGRDAGTGKPSGVSRDLSAEGVTIALGEAVVLRMPADAVPDVTRVTIAEEPPPGAPPGAQSVGSGVAIDLGGQTLAKTVTLEIAFDPETLPADSTPETVFAAYFDESANVWVPVDATVDTQRNVVVVRTDHLSRWNLFSWNWKAWIAVLNDTLTLNVTNILHAAALLTNDCPQSGPTVVVDSGQANNVIQGCVERDDPERPELRVVNPKSFYFEVRPISGGNGYPSQTMLGPGEDLTFQANTSDPAPLIVQAEITQRAGLSLVIHLTIQMLPGLNEFGLQGPVLACMTERLADVSYFVSATEALLDRDGANAAEHLIQFLHNEDAVRRFITVADDCGYGPAPTWSWPGINSIGDATATILSAVDFAANYLLNTQSQVAFRWTQDSPAAGSTGPATPPVDAGPSAPADSGSSSTGRFEIGGTVWVDPVGDCARIRAIPALNSPTAGCLSAGTELVLTKGPVTGDGFQWWGIAVGRGTGWVNADSLTVEAPPGASTPGAPESGVVAYDGAFGPEGCAVETTLHSIEGVRETSITFENGTGSTVRIYWLDYSGQRQLWETLGPGDSYVQGTYLTHPWVAVDDNGTCLGVFEPQPEPATAHLTRR